MLLAGLGDNAHVFDEFAYQFINYFHVIGITRRGFGRSSQPEQGYDLATKARDVIKVLDTLSIREAVLVGHSLAGTELNKIGAVYPDRVKKLVYLDALDNGWGGWTTNGSSHGYRRQTRWAPIDVTRRIGMSRGLSWRRCEIASVMKHGWILPSFTSPVVIVGRVESYR